MLELNKHCGVERRRNSGALRISAAEILFYGIILSLPFEYLSMTEGLSITKIIGIVFIPLSLTQWQIFYRKPPLPIAAVLLFVGIGFMVDLVKCRNFDIFVLNEFSRPMFLWVLLLVAYNLARNNRLERIVGIVFAATQMLAVFQCFGLGGNMKVYEAVIAGEYGERIAALGGDPNSTAVFIAIGLVYSLARGFNLVRTKMLCRLLCFLSVGICFYAILKTGSRGGLVALGCGVVSMFFVRRGVLKQIMTGLIIICVLIAMVITVMRDSFVVARFQAEKDRSEFVIGQGTDLENMNTGGRFRIWEASWGLICESPIFGYGATMHSIELGARLNTKTGLCVTHNIFLSVLIATGVSGFFCFLYFIVTAFRSVWIGRTMDNGKIVLLWAVIMLTGGMTLNLETAKMFWIVMALSLAFKDVHVDRTARR